MRALGMWCVATALFLTVPTAGSAEPVHFDLAKSELTWTGRKVTGSHHGVLRLRNAQGAIAPDHSLSGEFEVEMASLRVDDIKDPTDNAKLTNHLKSEDFFNVGAFPAAKFTITKSEPILDSKPGEPNTMVHGNLSITGITQPLSFPVRVEVKEGVVHATGEAKVDRTKYNIRYGSGQFFENLGDKLIYDEFSVELKMVGSVG